MWGLLWFLLILFDYIGVLSIVNILFWDLFLHYYFLIRYCYHLLIFYHLILLLILFLLLWYFFFISYHLYFTLIFIFHPQLLLILLNIIPYILVTIILLHIFNRYRSNNKNYDNHRYDILIEIFWVLFVWIFL